jgi:hypothetical protein
MPAEVLVDTAAANNSEAIRTWEYLPAYYRLLTDFPVVKKLISPLMPEMLKAYVRNSVARQYPYRTTLTEDEKAVVLERLRPDLIRLRDHWKFHHGWCSDNAASPGPGIYQSESILCR